MNPGSALQILRVAALLLVLGGCGSNPAVSEPSAPPKSELQFVDLQGFDRDLAGSLSAPLPQIEVSFYERIGPSALPERLQTWMASVEAGGGRVKVVPPKGSVTPKDPFMLISAISALWSASKVAKEVSTKSQFSAAHGYDAEIQLKQDAKGDSVLDKIVFVQRKK